MSNENDFEDITNNFLEVHDIAISCINIPNNLAKVTIQIDYDRKEGDNLPQADEIINCLSPVQARRLIEQLQQSLDALESDIPTFSDIQIH